MKRIYPAFAYGEGPREHCYWSDTATMPAHPELEGTATAEVAVIGAGFTGLNAALRLAKAGVDVAVVEAQSVGWGASGRNGGFCCLGGAAASDTSLRRRFGEAARREYRQAEMEAVRYAQDVIVAEGIECDRHSEGETLLAHSQKAWDGFARRAEEDARDYGVTPVLTPQDGLAELGLKGPFFGAMTTPAGFALNPLKYALGLAGAAQRAGARIFARSPVQKITYRGDYRLETPQGTLRARRLIVATNGYSSEDLPGWLAARYMPIQSHVMVTRDMRADEIAAQGWTSRQMCYDDRFFLHYFRLMPNNRMLFGTRGGLISSARSQARACANARRHFETMFPAWKHVDTPYHWTGLLSYALHRTPYTGPIPEMEGAFTSLSYHGNGVAMGSYAGALLADLAQGRMPARLYPQLMQHLPGRFPLGRFRRATMWPVYVKAVLQGD